MFDNIGGGELLVVLFVVFILFGPNKIPELSKGLGKGIRQFRDAMNGVQRDIENATRMDTKNDPVPEKKTESPSATTTDPKE